MDSIPSRSQCKHLMTQASLLRTRLLDFFHFSPMPLAIDDYRLIANPKVNPGITTCWLVSWLFPCSNVAPRQMPWPK